MALGRIPWDIAQIRDWIKTLVIKLKLNIQHDKNEEFFTMAVALSAAAKKMFFEKSEMMFSAEPLISRKAIVHFDGRMRVDAMGKFNKTTAFSAVHFYASQQELDNGLPPLGTLILYVEKDFISELLRILQYPFVDDEDEEAVKDGCGAVINLIAGYFKRELLLIGYKDMEMSHFKGYVNYALDGVEVPSHKADKYEIIFEIDKEDHLVVEMVMGNIPRRNAKGS